MVPLDGAGLPAADERRGSRAFMHAKLAGLLHGEETVEPFKETWQARQRMPGWGDTERERSGKRGARERE